MKLIVGLGNPGEEYEKTRHNIGFMVLDHFAQEHNISLNKKKFNGFYQKFTYNNEQIILLKPLSYMNLSGEVVRKFSKWYHIKLTDLLIISDDLDMEVAKIKLKKQGSSGGHNGLKNIEQNLRTQEYNRLKIGIFNDKTMATKDYVLGKFNKEELTKINNILPITNNILNDFVTMDFEKIMSKYN